MLRLTAPIYTDNILRGILVLDLDLRHILKNIEKVKKVNRKRK